MLKEKEISLTGEEVKQFKATGHTTHTKAGITYIIACNEKGHPFVEKAIISQDDLPSVNFSGFLNYLLNGLPVYKGE